MSLQFHPYSLYLAFSALISALGAAFALQRRRVPGAISLTVNMLGLAVWAGTYAWMWASTELKAQVFWLSATYLGVAVVPTTFLTFVLHISGQDRWITKRNVALLSIEPALLLLTIITNDYHHLFHTSFAEGTNGRFSVLEWERGPLLWINILYSYILILIGLAVLIRTLLRVGPLYRAQLITVLAGVLIPFATNIYTEFIPNSLGDLDLTPFAFSASSLLFAYALLGQRLLDLLPIARSRLIESMSDGVMVLDSRWRIVDMNPAAQRFLKAIINDSLIGKDVRTVFPAWSDVIQEYTQQRRELHFEIQGRLNPSRQLGLSVTPLFDPRNRPSGHLVVFQDITERKQVEGELREANRKLQSQLHKINLLQKRLREQAIRDPLTNLFNRRYLEETLERELSRAGRESYPVSILMMDVDGFKQINDTYGHKAGDHALKELADLLRLHVRRSDICCRYGGEEFVIVMPQTAIETAIERAERLRQEVYTSGIYRQNPAIRPAISVGIAAFPSDGADGEGLLHAADQAMYAAKGLGGNRVVAHAAPQRKLKTAKGTLQQ